MVCKKCGNVLDKNDKYCGNCGQKVNGKINKYVLIIIVIIIISIIGIFVSKNVNWQNKGNNDIKDNGDISKENKEIEEIAITKWNFDENKNITNGTITLNIGDYINYNEKEGATDTIYISNNNGYREQTFNLNSYTGKWQVLGIENNRLVITTEKTVVPEGENGFYLVGAEGYKNGVEELDNISKLYAQGKGAISGRSIKVEDINSLTGYKPQTSSDYGYRYDVDKMNISKDSKIYETLFKKFYWLASTYNGNGYINYNSYGLRDIEYFGIDIAELCSSSGNTGGYDKRSNGVRPVVCLDEKVQLEKDTNNENTYNIKIQ